MLSFMYNTIQLQSKKWNQNLLFFKGLSYNLEHDWRQVFLKEEKFDFFQSCTIYTTLQDKYLTRC